MKHQVAIGFLLIALAEHSDGAVTPLKSWIDLKAEANAGIGLIENDQLVTQAAGLSGLSATVFAQALNGAHVATAESTASASWISAAAGEFSLHTRFASADYIPSQNARVAAGGLGWAYTFVSDMPATFTLNYAITHNLPQTWGMRLTFGELIDYGAFQTINGPSLTIPSSGNLAFPVAANQVYTFTLYDGSNLNHFLPEFNAEMTGAFSFQITPVPEPSGLMFLFTTVACFIRRRPTKLK
jgi:hypothetical protein